MSLEFLDGGGQHYDTGTANQKWDQVSSTSWAIVHTGTEGRWGGRCLEATLGGSVQGGWAKDVSAADTKIVQFAFRIKSIGAPGGTPLPLIGFAEGGTQHAYIGFRADSLKLQAHRGALGGAAQLGSDSAIALNVGTWYYGKLKIKVHDSAGTFDFILGTTTVFSMTGLDTRNGGTSGLIDRIWVGASSAFGGGTLATVQFQDIAMCSTSGSAPLNDFHAEGRAHKLDPTGNGATSNWTPSAGSNYQCVDDAVPNGNTDYVESATSGDVDLYTLSDLPITPTTIYAVQPYNSISKTDAGSATVASAIRTGGTTYAGTGKTVAGSAYKGVTDIWETNPGTAAAFTPSEINALEGGVKRV
jgi:hypothetical protein